MRRIVAWLGMWSVIGWFAGSPVLAQEGRPRPEQIFDRLDKNDDGKITSDEVPEQRREMFGRLVEKGDENGDGALSRDEFIKVFPHRG
ncbi:MAG TPA: EF-hand domain-containing protein, partial [Planctomycetaceae bacterium]|nr:EF-hand domain-containing protein [Planctomycetaceae bacterium]